MESPLCSSHRLHEPSVPARTQPDPGAAPALYRPPLFQVGHYRDFKPLFCLFPPVVDIHPRRHHRRLETASESSRAGFGEGCTTVSTEGCTRGSPSRITWAPLKKRRSSWKSSWPPTNWYGSTRRGAGGGFIPDSNALLPQKIAQLEQEKGRRSRKAAVLDKSPTAWARRDHLSAVNTPQDDYGGFITARGPDAGLIVLADDVHQSSETCLSNGSDQESGIADLSCRSPVSEDSARDQDSDEAASAAP